MTGLSAHEGKRSDGKTCDMPLKAPRTNALGIPVRRMLFSFLLPETRPDTSLLRRSRQDSVPRPGRRVLTNQPESPVPRPNGDPGFLLTSVERIRGFASRTGSGIVKGEPMRHRYQPYSRHERAPARRSN